MKWPKETLEGGEERRVEGIDGATSSKNLSMFKQADKHDESC